MNAWPSRVLLVGAALLVVAALLWLALDSIGSADRAERSSRLASIARELLPPEDAALDADEDDGAAFERLAQWMWSDGNGSRLADWDRSLGSDRNRPECWTQEQASGLALCDEKECQDALTEIHAVLMRPRCRLVEIDQSGGGMQSVPNWSLDLPPLLERECLREFHRGRRGRAVEHLESAFALAAHAREMPTVGACWESDGYFLRASETLRILAERGALDAALAVRVLPWITPLHPEADWLRAIEGERALFGEYAWTGLHEGDPPHGVYHPVDPFGLLYSKLLRPWRALEERKYDTVLDEKRALVEQHPWEKLEPPGISPWFMIARTLSTKLELDGERRLRVQHARDLAETAALLALDRAESGSFPLTLDVLGSPSIEPVTKRPYLYVRHRDGCLLALPEGGTSDDPAWCLR